MSAPPAAVPGGRPRVATAPVRGPAAASRLPLWLGVGAVAVSLAIAVVVLLTASAPVQLLGAPVRLVLADDWWLSFIGYVLTPMIVIACYGWDAIAQRNSLRLNRNYVPAPSYTRVLLWLAGAGILLGAWHALNLSVPLSEALGWSG